MNNKYLSDCYKIFTFIKYFIASMHIFTFILSFANVIEIDEPHLFDSVK